MLRYFIFILLPILFSLSCSREAENSVVSSDGVTISYEVRGKGDPTIIFVHGWTNTREVWNEQIAHFSRKYRTIAMDLPGTGRSGNNRSLWSMQAFADDVTAIVRKEKLDQIVLVGFSMGGPVVVEAASRLPDETIGVVLVEAIPDPYQKIPEEMIPTLDSLYMDLVSNLNNEKLLELGFYKKNPEENFARVMEMYPKDASRTGWRESQLAFWNWINMDCTDALKRLEDPLVSINSDLLPTDVEAFRRLVPIYEAKIMTGNGHLVFWDDPEGFHQNLEASIQGFIQLQP